MSYQIPPHGARLIERIIKGEEEEELREQSHNFKKLIINSRQISDLEMIAIGAFSPLEGFMLKEDYESVLESMRLQDGTVWSIPITLAIDEEQRRQLKENDDVLLISDSKEPMGVIKVEEIYSYDKEKEAEIVYRTKDLKHPGVEYLYSQGDYLIAGKVKMFASSLKRNFKNYYYTPQQTREEFSKRGWKKIVGFQTRNPIHRAHEFIIKCALEIVDGLFLNPLVGKTKRGDIPAEVRMKCYEVLVRKYFPQDRVFIAVYGASMRYAGPREAILHAIVRKNFGCTHFIVGRDHAGVGSFYGPYDAQHIFDEFQPQEIGIIPLFFENAFYCCKCQEMRTAKTCPHPQEEHLSFSGTKVRQLLEAGEVPPPEFTRPEVANILLEWWQSEKGKECS